MKSKQLANVLIKVLGLSVFINGILSLTGGLLALSQLSRGMPWQSLVMPGSHGIFAMAIGIYLIETSAKLF